MSEQAREPLFFEQVAEEAEPKPEASSAGGVKPPGRTGSGVWDESGREDWRSAPIEDLSLTMRSYNVLRRNGLITLGLILSMSEDELLGLQNFSRKCYDELRERLDEFGLGPVDAPWDSVRGVN
jgi:DNA-directed RNA polymerase alpha subunit